MDLLLKAKTSTIEDLTNITDALTENDPNATDDKSLYFQENIHNYIKATSIALIPKREFFVDEDYLSLEPGTSESGHYFGSISAFYEKIAIIGSGSTNKALVHIKTKAANYSENIDFDINNCHITFKGSNMNACIISGNLNFSKGIHIFDNIGFIGNINISGGVVVFRNCTQKSGDFLITGNSYVFIEDCDGWSPISISGDNNEVFIENNKGINEDESSASINLASSMTGGVYIVSNNTMAGRIIEGTNLTCNNNNARGTSYIKPNVF